MSDREQFRMSVILLVGQRRERAARCLRSILEQSIIDQVEVLLVGGAMPGAAALPGSDHPSVRVLQPPDSTSFGDLHAEGVFQASTPIVTFIEEHCVARPGWAEALLHAHEGEPAVGIGGELHNLKPDEPLAQLIHRLFDGPWRAPAVEGVTRRLPGGNASYKREILMRYRDRLGLYFQSEGLLQARLIADGSEFWIEPEAKFDHEYDQSSTELLSRVYWQGQVTGAARAELAGGRSLGAFLSHFWTVFKIVAGHLTRFPAVALSRRPSVLRRIHLAVLFPIVTVMGELSGFVRGRASFKDRPRGY